MKNGAVLHRITLENGGEYPCALSQYNDKRAFSNMGGKLGDYMPSSPDVKQALVKAEQAAKAGRFYTDTGVYFNNAEIKELMKAGYGINGIQGQHRICWDADALNYYRIQLDKGEHISQQKG